MKASEAKAQTEKSKNITDPTLRDIALFLDLINRASLRAESSVQYMLDKNTKVNAVVEYFQVLGYKTRVDYDRFLKLEW